MNDYPFEFIEKFVKKRISFLNQSDSHKKISPKENCFKNRPKIKVPFKTDFFDQLKKRCKKFKIDVIPVLNKELSNVIKKGKDVLEKMQNSGVVYRIKCKNCPAAYIGETNRKLRERLSEYKRDVRNNNDSVIATHCNTHNHSMGWENTSILDRESVWRSRLISEMLHIHLEKLPTLHKKEDTQELSKIYTRILDCIGT